MRGQAYQKCLKKVLQWLQLQEADANVCAHALYHELSKHTHGNMAELIIDDTEYTIMEAATLEAVFRALKRKGCFLIPMTIRIQ
jgi:hypothetical protein